MKGDSVADYFSRSLYSTEHQVLGNGVEIRPRNNCVIEARKSCVYRRSYARRALDDPAGDFHAFWPAILQIPS